VTARSPGGFGCRLVVGDEFLHRDSFDRLADHLERQVLKFFEPHARFAHVQFLAGFGPRFAEPGFLSRFAIGTHEVNRHVVLLRGQ